jgi:hypothetical protein
MPGTREVGSHDGNAYTAGCYSHCTNRNLVAKMLRCEISKHDTDDMPNFLYELFVN